MKKKTAYITFGIGGALVIGLSPLFINWACRGMIDADPRAHYLAGLGRIGGWFGAEGFRNEFTQRADRVYLGRVLVEIPAATEDEMTALYEEAASNGLFTAGRLDTTRGSVPGTITFEIQGDVEEEFRKHMTEFQAKYRQAQQAGDGDA